jgi:putative phosphoesterase
MEAIEREPSVTTIIHLGDCASDGELLNYVYSIPMIRVAGNCDSSSDLPREVVLELEGVRVLITHGHLHGVKKSLEHLIVHATKESCNIVLYGHTHCASVVEQNNILFVNPGTLKEDSEILSYARLDITHSGVVVNIVTLE